MKFCGYLMIYHHEFSFWPDENSASINENLFPLNANSPALNKILFHFVLAKHVTCQLVVIFIARARHVNSFLCQQYQLKIIYLRSHSFQDCQTLKFFAGTHMTKIHFS